MIFAAELERQSNKSRGSKEHVLFAEARVGGVEDMSCTFRQLLSAIKSALSSMGEFN